MEGEVHRAVQSSPYQVWGSERGLIGCFPQKLPLPLGTKDRQTFQTRLAYTKTLGQEGAGEVQVAGEQRMEKRSVSGEAGGQVTVLEVLARTSGLSKSRKTPRAYFK